MSILLGLGQNFLISVGYENYFLFFLGFTWLSQTDILETFRPMQFTTLACMRIILKRVFHATAKILILSLLSLFDTEPFKSRYFKKTLNIIYNFCSHLDHHKQSIYPTCNQENSSSKLTPICLFYVS